MSPSLLDMREIENKKKTILISGVVFLASIFVLGGIGVFLFVNEPTTYYQMKEKVLPFSSQRTEENKKIEEDVAPVSNEFGLVIPKIGVNVPIVADVDGLNPDEYFWKVTQGVAHFKHAEAHDVVVDGAFPGEEGNVFLFGHSQIPGGDTSKYQSVFNDLPVLEFEDKIIVYFQGERYNYSVIEGKVIEKNELYYLEKTESEILHLMTCWPLGFNNKRYIVIARREL